MLEGFELTEQAVCSSKDTASYQVVGLSHLPETDGID